VPISSFLLFLVSEEACGEKRTYFWQFLAYFLRFLPQLKNFFRKLSVCIILVLDATFVPNSTFVGLLRPEIPFGEQNSHPPRYPHIQTNSQLAYFAISEPPNCGTSVYDECSKTNTI